MTDSSTKQTTDEANAVSSEALSRAAEGTRRLRKRRRFSWFRLLLFLLCVVAPTAAAFYYVENAKSPTYVSEVSFAIRSRDGQASMSGLGAIAGNLGIGLSGSNDIYAVRKYLQSAELFETVDKAQNFSASAQRPDRDWLVRLPDDATAEEKLNFFRSMNQILLSSIEQIVTIRAQAFEPKQAQALAGQLIDRSEAFVNQLNQRAKSDFVTFAQSEVKAAEERVLKTRLDITDWRNANSQVDPQKVVEGQMQIITTLEAELAKTRAELTQMRGIQTDVRAAMKQVESRERALIKQIKEEKDKIAGQSSEMAKQLSDFERLQIERDLAEKAYANAIEALRAAQQEAVQKQKYIVVTAAPSLPEEAAFPRPWFHPAVTALYGLGAFLVLLFLLSLARDYREAR